MYDFTLVDAHVHPFITPSNTICQYALTRKPEDMVAKLKEVGVTLCCGSVIMPGRTLTEWEDVAECNAECFEFADKFPDFLIPGIHIHAMFAKESCDEIQKYFDAGKLHWIGEIVPYHAGTNDYAVKTLFPVYELLSALELPLNLHPTGLTDIEVIVKNFPKLNVVMAHPAERDSYLAKIELMKKYSNLYLDLSGTGIFRWGMLRYAINICGSEKILFGSDFPICSPGMNLGGVLSEHLTDPELENILYKNFERLTQQ